MLLSQHTQREPGYVKFASHPLDVPVHKLQFSFQLWCTVCNGHYLRSKLKVWNILSNMKEAAESFTEFKSLPPCGRDTHSRLTSDLLGPTEFLWDRSTITLWHYIFSIYCLQLKEVQCRSLSSNVAKSLWHLKEFPDVLDLHRFLSRNSLTVTFLFQMES